MEPNLRRAVELFSQGIRQGSLFTKSGNPQNFSGSRKPFIGSDPIPVNQGRAPSGAMERLGYQRNSSGSYFRPDPVSPGQLNVFDVRANPSSSFDPSLERTGPPRIPFSPNPPSSFNPSLERIGPPGPLRSFGALERIGPPGPLRSLTGSAALTGEVRSVGPFDVRSNPPSSFNPSLERIGPPGPLRSLTGSAALTGGGGSSPSVMDLLKTAGAFGTTGILGALGLAAKLEGSAPEPNYRNLGYASEADMRGRIGAQELLESGRYVPGSQQQSIPKREGYNLDNVRKALDTPASRPLNDRTPLPQNNPTGNTMVPASNPFTKFFVDDANRLTPTARELATATGGVQTRDLGSLTS
ncbi:hypothetical protein EB118_25915, partial [bacterium]|nr:hypothetical protein [bacterium]